ncbi:MAG: UDP-glucose 4-epimerase GalE [Bacilli bacterium]|nr:UDP-glucose 4-epimerase GalE [Bacilli bacterium]
MNILVVGGAGYIGSHCVKRLADEKYNVYVIDNLSKGHIQAVDKRAKFFRGDLCDSRFLNEFFKLNKIDAVLHFAAMSLVGESVEKPLDYFCNNVLGMQFLLNNMVKYGVKKIIFSSSAAVYGEPKNIPITEENETNPTSPYGESKLMMEKIMKWTDRAYGVKYVALRYFNVAGADKSGTIGEVHIPETHLIPKILEVCLKKEEFLTIYGNDYDTVDGTCIRDYIHIDDLIDAHILALKHLINGGDSKIYNLGSESGFSVKEILEAAIHVTGIDIPYKIGLRRAGDPSILIASSNKIKKELNWSPKMTKVEDCIESAWKFHKMHKQGY